MKTARLRKQGNSVVVTIPASETKKLDLEKNILSKQINMGIFQ